MKEEAVREFGRWKEGTIKKLLQEGAGDTKWMLNRLAQFPTTSAPATNYGYLVLKSGEVLAVAADKTDGLTDYLFTIPPVDARRSLRWATRMISDAVIKRVQQEEFGRAKVETVIEWFDEAKILSDIDNKTFFEGVRALASTATTRRKDEVIEPHVGGVIDDLAAEVQP